MSYNLTSHNEIFQGRFWFPDNLEKIYEGQVELVPGKDAVLRIQSYETNGLLEFGARIDENSERTPVFRNRKIIYGKSENGEPLTLLKCYVRSSGTLCMAKAKYECELLLEGVNLSEQGLKFNGLRMIFDFQCEWIGKSVFQTSYTTSEDNKTLESVIVNFCKNKVISIDAESYRLCEFIFDYRSCRPHGGGVAFKNHSEIHLSLKKSETIDGVINIVQQWEWFLSLFTRQTIKIKSLSVEVNDLYCLGFKDQLKRIRVWKKRPLENLLERGLEQDSFYCRFSDVEGSFSSILDQWLNIQESWAAVLHRFFSISQPRGLWANEEFLFLAQAIECVCRIRMEENTGRNIDFSKAAKDIYIKSSKELQKELGPRQVFQNQLHKSRNYYTHYDSKVGEDYILSGDDLMDFNEKLRWVVESAIMQEVGIPESIIRKVWAPQLRTQKVVYED